MSDNKIDIEIMQIISPHKFWFKIQNNDEAYLLKQLDDEIAKYATNFVDFDGSDRIQDGDVIVAYSMNLKKWIRGNVGIVDDSRIDIDIWAIDYARQMVVYREDVIPLIDPNLSSRKPLNVHIGGLSDILPAAIIFDMETLTGDVFRADDWSERSIEKMNEWIQKGSKFIVKSDQSHRQFGLLICNCDDGEFCVAEALCNMSEAIRSENYIDDVVVLTKDDFMRLNHQLLTLSRNEDNIVEEAQNIWSDDDAGSVDMLSDNGLDPEPIEEYQSQSSQLGTSRTSMIDTNSLSTISVTLSLKSLYKLNTIIISQDAIKPLKRWKELIFFPDGLKKYLQQFRRFDDQTSFGWPHVMRGNSLLMIGEHSGTTMVCMPTICSLVHRTLSKLDNSNFKPIAMIIVNDFESVAYIASYYRRLLKKAGLQQNVFCLKSSIEIELLTKEDNIDILITTVFCFQSHITNMSSLFTSKRLQYVWFDRIDEMCQNIENMDKIMEKLLSQEIQILTSSRTFCPIMHELFNQMKLPILSIGDRTPFEAAIAANSCFWIEIESTTTKIKNLIGKLDAVNSALNGSVVIICKDKTEVMFVTGHLTQSNIKCVEFDDHLPINQFKLLNWTKSSVENHPSSRNILVCDDSDLESLPIRSAKHIIHYSLPNKLDTFEQRHITCYAFYEEYLRSKLIEQDSDDFDRSISLVYFDETLIDDYIQIYETLARRVKCDFPDFLTDTIKKLRNGVETMKTSQPLCSELITKAKNCDIDCPYRHILNERKCTLVPQSGFVNMELLEVLTPNHFAVRVTSYKKRLEHKSKPINDENEEYQQFDEDLAEYYANTENLYPLTCTEEGDMVLVFHQNHARRGRIISSSKNVACVYFIDIGKTYQCNMDDIYELHEDFHDFPPQIFEIYTLDYAPSEGTKWPPKAKKVVEAMINPIEFDQTSLSFLQAQVIRAIDHTLLVTDLKILCKTQNGLVGKIISHGLLKYKLAVEKSVKLHEIFMATEGSSMCSSTESTFQNKSAEANNTSKTDIDQNLRHSEAFAGHLPSENDNSSDLDGPTEQNDESMNTTVSSLIKLQDNSQPESHSDTVPCTSQPGLDDIFGSLPEEAKILNILQPLKCNEADNKSDESVWLIDFSDDQNNELISTDVAIFPHVRVITDIDDLL